MSYAQLAPEEYALFPQVVKPGYLALKSRLSEFMGYQKLVMLDRYSLRDTKLRTLKEGDLVVAEVKPDPDYPTQGFGRVKAINGNHVTIKIEYPESVEANDGSLIDLENFVAHKSKIAKPLEVYWEQICYRVARGVASVEKSRGLRRYWRRK